MARFQMFFVLVLLLISGSAQAFVDEVYFSDSILEGEDLAVLVEGYLQDSCWEFLGWSTNTFDQFLVVNIDTIDTNPGGICLQVITPYTVSAVFPALPEGLFTLRIYENRTPWPALYEDFSIEVISPVAEDAVSWDAIKSLYR